MKSSLFKAKISELFFKLTEAIGKLPPFILIFTILSLIYLRLVPTVNEEVYMQLAKYYVNPNWIPGSFTLSEFAGARVLYQTIIGYMLKAFDFTIVLFACKLIMISAFTYILTQYAKLFSLNNYQILFFLLILFLGNQSLFAGSWMMVTLEPKGIAYIFVLWGLLYMFNKKPYLFLLLFIIASYFHLLVGVYSFAFIVLTIFCYPDLLNYNRKTLVLIAIIFGITLLPNVLYIKSSLIEPAIHSGFNTDWIYTYFAMPMHTALFKDADYFYRTHLFGILIAAICWLYMLLQKKQLGDNKIAFVRSFVLISLGITLLLVPIIFIDSNGIVLKYYLYRINTLTSFFLFIYITLHLWQLLNIGIIKEVNVYIVLLSMFFMFKLSSGSLVYELRYILDKDQLAHACTYINKHTNSGDVILSFRDEPCITRMTECDMFVSGRFIPADYGKIQEWYRRLMIVKDAENNKEILDRLIDENNLKFILSEGELLNSNGYLVEYSNSKYFVYSKKN